MRDVPLANKLSPSRNLVNHLTPANLDIIYQQQDFDEPMISQPLKQAIDAASPTIHKLDEIRARISKSKSVKRVGPADRNDMPKMLNRTATTSYPLHTDLDDSRIDMDHTRMTLMSRTDD